MTAILLSSLSERSWLVQLDEWWYTKWMRLALYWVIGCGIMDDVFIRDCIRRSTYRWVRAIFCMQQCLSSDET